MPKNGQTGPLLRPAQAFSRQITTGPRNVVVLGECCIIYSKLFDWPHWAVSVQVIAQFLFPIAYFAPVLWILQVLEHTLAVPFPPFYDAVGFIWRNWCAITGSRWTEAHVLGNHDGRRTILGELIGDGLNAHSHCFLNGFARVCARDCGSMLKHKYTTISL